MGEASHELPAFVFPSLRPSCFSFTTTVVPKSRNPLHTKPLHTIFWEVARKSWHQILLLLCCTTKDEREGEEDLLDES